MEYKLLKRQYSKQGIINFLVFNVIVAFVWYSLLYVKQDDYSQFDISKIQDKIKEITNFKVLYDVSEIRSKSLITSSFGKIQEKSGTVFIESDLGKFKCKDKDTCPIQLKFLIKEALPRTTIELFSNNQIVFSFKDEQSIPKDLDQIIYKILTKKGGVIDVQRSESMKTIDSIQMIQVIQTIITPSGTSNVASTAIDDSLQIAFDSNIDRILSKIYTGNSCKPQVTYSRRFMSQSNNIGIFQKVESETSQTSQIGIKMKEIVEFMEENNVYHLIPEYSIRKKNDLKQIRINVFDNQLLFGSALKLIKASGEQYEMLVSENGEEVFAIQNYENKDDISKQVAVLLSHTLQNAYSIETFSELSDQLKRKKITLTNSGPLINDIDIFISQQKALKHVQSLKDLIAVIEILKANELEKNKKIYKGKSVFELTQQLYDTLLSSTSPDDITKEVDELIAILYYTKEINPPYFFSFSFSVGVYLPLLSPLVFPPLLSFFQYLKAKKTGAKTGEDKIKTE